jgi:signal transduction histidine kinase
VRDTGPGLTAQQIERLFKPFVQVHESQGQVPGGSGLGLYISKGIVESHGGTMAVHSAGAGKGASFSFTIPRKPPGPAVEDVQLQSRRRAL